MSKSSTDEVDTLHFMPHGKVEVIFSESDVIIYKAKGPFNSELITALISVEQETLHEYKSRVKSWSEVVIFEKSCMILEDALKNLELYLKTLKSDGKTAQATAFVFLNEVEGCNMMMEKYQQCYIRAGLKYRSFCNEKEALQWAKSQLKTD